MWNERKKRLFKKGFHKNTPALGHRVWSLLKFPCAGGPGSPWDVQKCVFRCAEDDCTAGLEEASGLQHGLRGPCLLISHPPDPLGGLTENRWCTRNSSEVTLAPGFREREREHWEQKSFKCPSRGD